MIFVISEIIDCGFSLLRKIFENNFVCANNTLNQFKFHKLLLESFRIDQPQILSFLEIGELIMFAFSANSTADL